MAAGSIRYDDVMGSTFRIFLYIAVSIGALLACLFAYEFLYAHPIWGLRAFNVRSGSMCPTVCQGERVFADMNFGVSYTPVRNDVVVLLYGQDQVLFVKRVIGLPGDTISPGPGKTILVNGRPWQPPAVCGKSLLPPENIPASVFPSTKVQDDQLFVIGDNVTHSLDSRFTQFEPVHLGQIVGKAALIYWSPESSRIGCAIH